MASLWVERIAGEAKILLTHFRVPLLTSLELGDLRIGISLVLKSVVFQHHNEVYGLEDVCLFCIRTITHTPHSIWVLVIWILKLKPLLPPIQQSRQDFPCCLWFQVLSRKFVFSAQFRHSHYAHSDSLWLCNFWLTNMLDPISLHTHIPASFLSSLLLPWKKSQKPMQIFITNFILMTISVPLCYKTQYLHSWAYFQLPDLRDCRVLSSVILLWSYWLSRRSLKVLGFSMIWSFISLLWSRVSFSWW